MWCTPRLVTKHIVAPIRENAIISMITIGHTHVECQCVYLVDGVCGVVRRIFGRNILILWYKVKLRDYERI